MDFFNEIVSTFLYDYFKLLFWFFGFYFKKDKSYYRPNPLFHTLFMTAQYSEKVRQLKWNQLFAWNNLKTDFYPCDENFSKKAISEAAI